MDKKSKPDILRNNLYMLAFLFRACPSRVINTFLIGLIDYGAWSFYSIIFYRIIFNAIERKLGFSYILIFMLIMVAAFLIINLFTSWFHQKHVPLTDQIISYKFNRMLFDKAVNVDLSCYEDPDFYNTYTLALREADKRAITVLETLSGAVSSIISSTFVVVTMFQLDRMIALFTLLPIVGSFYFGKLINKKIYDRQKETVPFERETEYVGRTVFLQKYAKEMRLTHIYDAMQDLYLKGYNGMIRVLNRYSKPVCALVYTRSFICYPLVFELVWLYAAYKVMVEKSISVGDFVVLSSAIVSATNMMASVMSYITSIADHALYVKNFKTFLSYKEKISEQIGGLVPQSGKHTLELKNVSFRYGKTDVLKNINMTIRSGEQVALVGHNGSGKSTLVKLLMRLYDVTDGEILLDGINIQQYDVKEYRKLFGTVFQDFQLLSMTVLENVAMREITDAHQRERCLEALRKSGAYEKIDKLSRGADTVLTREFDDEGAVLSGGEGQKVAVARMFAKDADIVILDEPSSALDPVAEYKMYETLAAAYEETDKMVVLISHRLSSAVLANSIYLLEQGELVESGGHAELMAQNGHYAELFTKQAKHYVDSHLGDTEVAL